MKQLAQFMSGAAGSRTSDFPYLGRPLYHRATGDVNTYTAISKFRAHVSTLILTSVFQYYSRNLQFSTYIIAYFYKSIRLYIITTDLITAFFIFISYTHERNEMATKVRILRNKF